jgi:hypothetical protein
MNWGHAPILAAMFVFTLLPDIILASETNLILTVDGVVYTNVAWGTATPATVTIFHSTGVCVVHIDKLPEEWQKYFDYNAQKAADYWAAESRAQEQVARRLTRDATGGALDAAVRPKFAMTFEMEVGGNHVEAVRRRYRELLTLQKTGNADYRVAIDLLVEACRRAIDYHYELKKEQPEFRGASGNFNNFRGGGNVLADNAARQELFAKKIAADAYYQVRAQLLEEAIKAWNEGLKQRDLADNKGHPVSKPPPKSSVADPYLQEAP